MATEKFKGMTTDQLDEELLKLKKEQFNLRFQAASGQLENTARIRIVRREIARVKTEKGSLFSACDVNIPVEVK